jgi:RNA polymerase sigma factor (sigma-70 family)
MNTYSDEDLLFMVSLQNENEKEAKEAFGILYGRHIQFLWNSCHKVCRDSELAKDVIQNTWMAIYKSSHTYDAKKSSVKTWMSIIAKNKMLDIVKGETEFVPLNEDFYSISNDEDEAIITSPEKEKLDNALNSLSERDKDILLTYMQYSDGNKHLPDEVISELCQRYNTLPATLRQIKKRSLDKMKEMITSN